MRLGEVVVDVAPLRSSRDFRLVFATQAISMLGTHLTSVAASLQIYHLTGSSVQVGLMSMVLGLSLLVGLVAGGVLADRVDRRRVVLVTRAVTAVVIAGLAVNAALPDPQVWFVYVAAVLAGGISGLGGPAMMAATPSLVAPGQLAAAGALTTLTAQLGGMVGPSLAGVIAAGPGVAMCFAIDAAVYVLGLALLAPLPALPPDGPAEAQHPLKAMGEGLRFLRGNQVVAGLLLIDVCAVVFAMPYALFPELGTEHFGGGPSTVGLLYTAPAVGSFFGALTSGWTGRVHHTGRALIGAVAVWGAAITCFGLSPNLWLALGFLALAGLGDTASEILRRALLQHYTPDRLQGRVGSLWLAQATAGPSVGNVEAGLVARALGSSTGAVAVGGLVCLAGVATLAVAMPGLRKATLHGPPDDASAGHGGNEADEAHAPAVSRGTPPAGDSSGASAVDSGRLPAGGRGAASKGGGGMPAGGHEGEGGDAPAVSRPTPPADDSAPASKGDAATARGERSRLTGSGRPASTGGDRTVPPDASD